MIQAGARPRRYLRGMPPFSVAITGAASGIGRSAALHFARSGARVLALDLDADGLGALAREAPGVIARRLDVRREGDWSDLSTWLEDQAMTLDALVNNAGIIGLSDGAPQDPERCGLETLRAVMATNFEGVVLGCRAAIRWMRARGGAIVNVASRSGLVGIPYAVAYAASKAAVINHTRSVALYCAAEGLAIRCNAVAPAAVDTPMWDPMLGVGPERAAAMLAVARDTPLRRFAEPREIVAAIAFLAAPEASYITGETLVVDGGLLAGSAAAPRRQGE